MLDALGIDTHVEAVYRTMLSHPNDGVAELAARLRCSEDRIRQGLEQLSALALVRPSYTEPIGFRAADPKVAMQRLLSQQQVALAAHQAEVATTHAAAETLVAECKDLVLPRYGLDSEFIEGPEAIRQRLAELGRAVRSEVMTLAPGGAHSEEDSAG